MRLAVLDQSTIVTGRPPAESIQETLRLARWCEQLGYTRYWLAEHHNSASQAGTAPEVLMAAIAATTRRIRVGSAGVMLPHYSSLKVAEQFRVLEAIAPGRIDLGLGRAPGSDGLTAYALNPAADNAADHFPSQVRDLLAWVRGERLVEGHPFRDVSAQPAGPSAPAPWILGSSDYGAQVAAHFGLPFCFRPLHHGRARGGACARRVSDRVPDRAAPGRPGGQHRRLGCGGRNRGGGRAAFLQPRAVATRAGPRRVCGAAEPGGGSRLPLHPTPNGRVSCPPANAPSPARPMRSSRA